MMHHFSMDGKMNLLDQDRMDRVNSVAVLSLLNSWKPHEWQEHNQTHSSIVSQSTSSALVWLEQFERYHGSSINGVCGVFGRLYPCKVSSRA